MVCCAATAHGVPVFRAFYTCEWVGLWGMFNCWCRYAVCSPGLLLVDEICRVLLVYCCCWWICMMVFHSLLSEYSDFRAFVHGSSLAVWAHVVSGLHGTGLGRWRGGCSRVPQLQSAGNWPASEYLYIPYSITWTELVHRACYLLCIVSEIIGIISHSFVPWFY